MKLVLTLVLALFCLPLSAEMGNTPIMSGNCAMQKDGTLSHAKEDAAYFSQCLVFSDTKNTNIRYVITFGNDGYPDSVVEIVFPQKTQKIIWRKGEDI